MRIIFRILLTYTQICIKISIMTDSKEMIKKLCLTPNKALGQNFLIDTEAISRIAALADCQGENVLEIGPGLGALTSALSEKAKNLLAVAHLSEFLRINSRINAACSSFAAIF